MRHPTPRGGPAQREVADAGAPRFIVEGGVALELRLRDRTRATKDIDIVLRDTKADLASTPADGGGPVGRFRPAVIVYPCDLASNADVSASSQAARAPDDRPRLWKENQTVVRRRSPGPQARSPRGSRARPGWIWLES